MSLRGKCGRWIVAALVFCGLVLPALLASAATPKRVLIVHSFGNAAPPFTTHSVAFETELTGKMKEPVDLDEVSLDVARHTSLEMDEALVALMRARQAKWQPDLVVPIGSPAGVFVARHRDRLFPASTPIVYTGMDKGRLPPGALEQNAAFVGESFDLRGWVEDILQIAPDTKNIAVIIGDSPLEHLWTEILKKEYQPFAGRVSFTWLNDLSLGGILERTKNLPPHSFILHILMMRDANGVTYNGDEVLKQIHAVANAPINGIYQHQLGLGITGGRLYQAEAEGVESARIAMRILRGEPASSFQPMIVGPLPPRYDWRELQKWEIDEKLLPKGSTILYRTPTVWERYRAWIIGLVTVILAQAVLIAALITNVVRRRRAERSLSESELRFRTMADAAPIMIWMSGLDKLCTFFNKAWLDFTGRTVEQELGDGWAEGVHRDDFAKCLDTYVRAFDAREPFAIQYRLRRSDGEFRWISDEGEPRYGARGDFLGYIGACVDITDVLKKDLALHNFEERVALAADAARLGVWELDTITGGIWVSDKVRELFDLDAEEAVDRATLGARVLSEDRAAREAAVNRAIKEQGEYETEYRIVLRDGTIRWISGRGRCVADEGGKPTRLLGVSMDVTERKEAVAARKRAEEEARRQREQIDLLGRASLLGEMTASLAHELDQPLAAIIANAGAGVRFIEGGEIEPNDLREMFSDVGSAARRARDLIQSVRNAIKKGSSVRGQTSMNSVVANVALMVRPDAAAYSCQVKTSLAENLPLVEADPIQMQQVLVNLVTNALHAMSETPSARRDVEIATQLDADGSVQVTVRDHGTGIAAEIQERLFEHFYTTKQAGLGMGLAIVRSIIEAHGGKITAGNAEGGGACFDFRLPAVAKSDGKGFM